MENHDYDSSEDYVVQDEFFGRTLIPDSQGSDTEALKWIENLYG